MSIDEITKRNNAYQELDRDIENQPEGMLEGRTCRPMDNAAIRASVGVCFALLFMTAVVGVSEYGCSFLPDDTNSYHDSDDNRISCYIMVPTIGFTFGLLVTTMVFGSLCIFATPTNLKKIPGYISDTGMGTRNIVVDACCPLNNSPTVGTREDCCNIGEEINSCV